MLCPDTTELASFLERQLAPDRVLALEEHFDQCDQCCRLVHVLGSPDPGPAPVHDDLACGDRVGRFEIIRRIAQGGMGVIYEANDPTLRRNVALKLLRVGNPGLRTHASARLLREAQALARLDHPNVVTVFDAGVHGESLFVAMELIDGVSFAEWLSLRAGSPASRSPRATWRDAVAILEQVARGLAAAHAAGLVHRDVKPANVMVSTGGRVKVLDFGLVQAQAEARMLPPTGSGSPAFADDRVTATGTLLGTPAYAAPEQLLGGEVDARSDVFSYCTMFYEAIYGRRPFEGRTVADLVGRMTADPPEFPTRPRLPGRIRELLQRGLVVDPDRRLASMQQLLRILARAPVRRRRWLIGAGAGSIAIAAAAVTYALGPATPGPRAHDCSPADRRLAAVWSGAHKQRLHARFTASGLPFAQDAYRLVERTLDVYARDWSAMSRQACEATYVHREQSERAFDLRMSCLAGRRQELEAVVTVLTQADRAAVGRAEKVVRGLGPIATCADLATLEVREAVPPDPRHRQLAAEVRRDLAFGRALLSAGQPGATELARSAVQRSRTTRHRPIEADALLLEGDAALAADQPGDAEAAFHAAVVAAEAAGDWRLAARAWTELVFTTGYRRADYAAARNHHAHAEAILERLGTDLDLRSRLDHALGAIYLSSGDLDSAQKRLEAALAAAERISPRSGEREAATVEALGHVALNQGRFQQAIAHHQDALQRRQRDVGENHPLLALSLDHTGEALYMMERWEEAESYFERALALRLASGVAPDSHVADSYRNLGLVAEGLHRYDRAVAYMQQALDTARGALAPDDPDLPRFYMMLGATQIKVERFADALSNLNAARDGWIRVLGADTTEVGLAENELGNLARARGDRRRAREHLRTAAGILAKGDSGWTAAVPLATIGQIHLEAGQPGRAIAPLSRSLALLEGVEAPVHDRAEVRFDLARALWRVGRHGQAKTLAARAIGEYSTAGDAHREARAAAEAWLRSRSRPPRGAQSRATQTGDGGVAASSFVLH